MEAERLRIFHVIAQLRFGAGRVVADAAVEQARRGHRVTVCVSEDADAHWCTHRGLIEELAREGVEVRVVGDFFHRRTGSIRAAGEALARERAGVSEPVVVHAHTAMAAAAGHRARPDALVATCHGWGENRPDEMNLQDSLAYQLCDAVLTYSRHWAERLTADLGLSHPLLIPMGLDFRRFPPLPVRPGARPRPLRILTVCELTRRKGVDLLLEAMPEIWRRHPQAELHVMGSGDAEEALKVRAAQLDPALKRIVFCGAVQDPYSRMAAFDLFVLASRSDNLPVVLLEAMLAGLPILATKVGGVPDLVVAAGCGAVVPPESARALARGALTLTGEHPSRLAGLGRSGEEFARREFDARTATARLERIYREVLRRTGVRVSS